MKRSETTALIRKQLRQAEWRHRVELDGDETLIRTDLDLETEFLDRCDLVFSVRDEDVLVMGIPRVTVKPSFREAVATYCTRVNFGLRYGKLVLSLDDGEIRYEYLLSAAAFAVDAGDAVTDLVSTACAVLERSVPPLNMVLTGVWTPLQAADAYRDSFKKERNDGSASVERQPEYQRLTADDYISIPACRPGF